MPYLECPETSIRSASVEVEMICYRCRDVDTKPSSVANVSSATYHASKEDTKPPIGFIIRHLEDQQGTRQWLQC